MPPTPKHPSLARRALPAVALTGVAIVIVQALDHPAAIGSAASVGASGDAAAAATLPAGTTPPADSAAPSTSPAAAPAAPTTIGRPAGSRPAPVPAPAPASTAAPATNPAPATGASSGACTAKQGPEVWTRFGPVAVTASVTAAGKLCDVKATEWPNDRGRSVAINNYALPILRQQALAANGANIDGVSGATVTSDGYRQSLQAALDARG